MSPKQLRALINRYLLLMSSVAAVVFLMDMAYLFTSPTLRTVENIVSTIFLELLVFVGLNALGSRFLFGPVDRFIKSHKDEQAVRRRVIKLPYWSAVWVAFLGLAYTAVIFAFMLYYDPDFAADPFLQKYYGVALLFFYSLFLGIFVFFMISRFTMTVKSRLYDEHGILFEPGWLRIGHKFALIYLVFLFVISFILVDLIQSGLLADIEAHQLIIIDIAAGMAIILSMFFFVAADLKIPLLRLVNSMRQVRSGDFSLKAPVISDDEIGIITSDFNAMVEGLRERELIRETFGKYVTKAVADNILSQSLDLSGEVRLATILFTDIEDYTKLSESMKPHELVDTLNDYFTFLVGVVSENKGIVNKFIGDSILAVFNAPLDDDQHARNAVRAAIDIQTELSRGRTFGKGRSLPTRIGINTGVIVAGNIGSNDRLEYTVIGDEVNVASRLEQLNKVHGTRILVGENTYEVTQRDFRFKKIGSAELKGRSKPLDVYTPELSGLSDEMKL